MNSFLRHSFVRRFVSAVLSIVVGLGPVATAFAQAAQYRIPLKLSTTEAVALTLAPDPVDFEDVAVGQVRTIQATLSNTGSVDAQGLTFATRHPFSVDGSACRYVPAGGDCPVWVSFSPSSASSVADTLTVRSGETVLDAVLLGNGVPLIADLEISDGGGWNFGNHVLGTVSPTKTLTLSNTGTGSLFLDHVGPLKGSDEYKLVHECPAVMAAGSSCAVTVHFEPGVLGQRLGAFRIKAVDGSVRDVWLLGYGILEGQTPELPLGQLSVAPEVNFGGLTLPAQGRVQSISMANTGSTLLDLTTMTLVGEGASAYSLNTTCLAQLAPYSACAVHLGFEPTELKDYPASVDFTFAVHEAPVDGEPDVVRTAESVSIFLKGAGTELPTELVAVPTSVDFGETPLNTPVRRAITLTNYSGEAQSLRVSYATNAENFVVLGGCSGQIEAGASCELELLYQAATPNLSEGELILVSRETNQTLSIPLTGAAPMPDLTVLPLTLRFGTTDVEIESPPKAVTLINTGLAPAQLHSVAITRAGSEFLLNTSACGGEVPAQGQCALQVRFKPYASGERVGALRIQSDDTENPVFDIDLTGWGQIGALSVNPTSAYFSSLEINTSATRTFTVSNRGPGTVRLTRVQITGAGASAYSRTDTCTELLMVGEGCEITVTFTPKSVSSFPASLNLYTGDGLSRQIGLSGWGHLPKVGALDIFPSPIEMGQVSIYRPAVRSVQLKSTGTAALEVESLTLSGADAARFSLTHSCEGIFSVSKTCSVTLTAHLDEIRAYSAALQVRIKDGALKSAPISALGAELDSDAQLTVKPSLVDFGTVLSGVPYEHDLVLTNTGAMATTILAPEVPAGVTLLSDCQGDLAPEQSCTLRFQLKVTSSLDTTLVLRTMHGQRIPVPIRATVPAPILELTPESLVFPATMQGQTSKPLAVQIRNTGTAALRLGEPRILGAGQYEYLPESTCPASIAPEQYCEILVRFSPLSEGAREAVLNSSSNDRLWPSVQVALSGHGLPDPAKYPGLSVSPSVLYFESTLPEASSRAQTVTLTNTGGALLTFEGIGLSSENAFSMSNNCGDALAPEQSCEVSVQFTPSVHAGANANLVIVSDALNAAVHNLPLRGASPDAATLRVAPAPVDLGVGAVDAVRTVVVVLHNEAEAPAVISSVTLGGEEASHFAVDASQCLGVLAVSGACEMTVSFTPSRAGRHVAQLQVIPSAGEPLLVPVFGSGPAAQARLTPDSLSFGAQPVGFASEAQEVVLTNTGTVALRVGAMSWGVHPAVFSVAQECPASLAVGESCILSITARPHEAGPQADLLTVASGHTEGVLAVAVHVEGVVPTASVLPTVLALGTVYQGAPVERSVQVNNTGAMPLFVKNVSFETNPTLAGFTQTNTCANGVQPGESCDVVVRLAPKQLGDITNALHIETASGRFTVPITSTGARLAMYNVAPSQVPTAGGVHVTISGAGFTADTQVVIGASAADQVVWVSPTQLLVTVPAQSAGFADVYLEQLGANAVSLVDALQYVEAPVLNGLAPNEGSIAGGWSAQLAGEHFLFGMKVWVDGRPAGVSNITPTAVTLAVPARSQVLAGPVNVRIQTPGGEAFLANALTYTIPPAALVFEGASGAFGEISQNAFYERTFTLRNVGASAVTLTNLSIEEGAGVFYREGGTCPVSFPVSFEQGASCTMTLVAHSTALGEASARLEARTNPPAGTFTMPLFASVIEPDYSLSGTPGTMTLTSGRFGVVAALSEEGGTNGTSTKTVYLNNSFGVAGTRIQDVAVSIAGQEVEQFTIVDVQAASATGGLRSSGAVIAADGHSATGALVDDGNGSHPHLAVTVRYAPAALGEHNTQLTISFNGGRVVGLPLHGLAQFVNVVELLGEGDFGINGYSTQPQTTQSTSKTYTLRSDPVVGKRLRVEAIRIQGADADSFIIAAYDKRQELEPINVSAVTPAAMVQGMSFEDLHFTVRFTPNRLGEHRAQLVVTSNSDGLPLALDLFGTGARDVAVELSEGTGITPMTDYPMTGIGASVVKDVFLRNVGTAGAVTFSGIQIVGSPAFTLVDYGKADEVAKTTVVTPATAARYMTTPVYGADASLGGATDFFSSIRFNPTYVGTHEAFVTIWHDAPGESTTFTLRGEAVRAAAALSSESSLPVAEPDGDFGMASFNGPGHASNQVVPKIVHVVNATQIGQLRVKRIQIVGEQAQAFAITSYPGMLAGTPPSQDIRPINMVQTSSAQALSIQLSFTPTLLGEHAAQLLVEHDGMNASPLVLDLAGFGDRDVVFAVSQGAGVVPLEPINGTALNTPVTRTIYLRNVGTAGVARYTGFTLEGSEVFAVKSVGLTGRDGTTYTPSVSYSPVVREGILSLEGADVRLAPRAQTDLAVTVEVTPNSRDTFSGQLTLWHDGPGGSTVVDLVGGYYAPELTFFDVQDLEAPIGGVDFGAVAVSTASETYAMVVQNTGNASVTLSAALLAPPAPFTYVETPACEGLTLDPAATCEVGLVFTPTQERVYEATQLFRDATQRLAITPFVLQGQGTLARMEFWSADGSQPIIELAFPNTEVGEQNKLSVLVRSTGTGALEVSDEDLTVTEPFLVVRNDCQGIAIEPEDGCLIELAFSPTVGGKFEGPSWSLSLTSNAANLSKLLLKGRTPPVPIVEVVAGGHHTFVRKADGTWWAAGYNGYGELGLGNTLNRMTFTQVQALMGATQVVTGSGHTFARKVDGTWWATGNNESGQLGLGNTSARSSFTLVPALTGATVVIPGANHTFARRPDGTWWVAGWNAYGQLGLGSTRNRSTFTQVPVLTGATQVVAGYASTFARKADGTWWATGNNASGQLGLGNFSNQKSFVQVPALTGATQVSAAGGFHTFARQADGAWWATGLNHFGQLGLGNTAARNLFTQVPDLASAIQVVTGENHTLALDSDGTWWAVGRNSEGQLGLGDTSHRYSLTHVPALTGATHVAAGTFHTFAVKSDGTGWATGYGIFGQLGLGSSGNRSSFTQVPEE